jgi:AbrB family looped-hinge helix DNA binding protein
MTHLIRNVMMKENVNSDLRARALMSANGRIVIPAALRQELGMAPGDTLLMQVEDGVLRIESYSARIRRIQQSLQQLISPDRTLSDELIAERREEARREEAEWAKADGQASARKVG